MGTNILLQIDTNWLVPLAHHAFPYKIEGRFAARKCVPTLTRRSCRECEFVIHYDDDKTRRSSNWQRRHCGSGMGETVSEWELQEGRMAVSTFLQQMGVSVEESESIASNSPAYLNMLVEGVRDLEQLSSSSSSSSMLDGNGVFNLNFNYRDKILHIAALKGDKGKLAYLESLGFTLSSSMNVARYISSSAHNNTLPSLINKVTSIKQLLFLPTHSTHDDHYQFLIKNIRLIMCHLSISLDEDMQHTFSFFEKVQAKRGDRIPNIILAFPPILLWNVRLLQTRVLALNQIDGVDKDYAKLMLKYPWVLSTSIQENYKEVLFFLYSVKVPKTWIDHAIKRQPQLLGCSTSKLKLMVDQFAELGVQKKKLYRVITRSPQLLLQKPEHFQQVVLFFENMGFDEENIGKILARCPEIFASSISKTLQRKIEFLSRIGVSKAYIPVVIRKYPKLLVSDIDKTLPQRIVYFIKLGLSEKDIAFMVSKFSPILGYSIKEKDVLRPKIEFLVNTMKRPVKEVVSYPRYFSYSLEKKIKPRYWVLKGRNIECSLKDMLGKNDEEFAAEFMGVGRNSAHDRL
ncbi:transcription termination factor MTERF2, chloroplastic isoform X2 [Trifolium pratense]|uniref:Uncharacterized protein n=1 Tax=Trifolium pratense TaxID=57577 RepID=A0ACB0L9S8_TRIPR|nr:transcription termination factor MTERF2, chloroplastic isoform X2 [Trifolium pratense]XP_045814285.1 transcription termination factor MTERF2, chloroplastic isoform X2 [Trifolium pratense]CAJ2665176.1 unnamed protein product [Trifolium pratense]